MANLSDGVIVITGAGGGMGEAMAHAFADAGSSVVIVDINGEGRPLSVNQSAQR